ncbi:MAG: HEAT repeat domain-containing protein [Verrucomicrobia bacterium]|nr:HEAT repeat domain-containing protein [Verrucomicrobiota bacterium]
MAINSLAHIGPSAAEAVPAVIRAVEFDNPNVRLAAVNFLLAMGPDAQVRISPLIRLVNDKDEGLAWAGLTLVARPARDSPKAMRAVTQALQHESFRVRGKAAITLGQLGARAKEGIPALQAALKDEYWNVREAAAEALKKIESGKD